MNQLLKWVCIGIILVIVVYYGGAYHPAKPENWDRDVNLPLKLSHQDSLIVVQNSLINFLKNRDYPKSYKSQPLQILPSDVVRLDSSLAIGEFSYILLPKGSNAYTLMHGMDYDKPVPYVEIVDFDIKQDTVRCLIIFRSSGQRLENFLNKKLAVDSVSEGEI